MLRRSPCWHLCECGAEFHHVNSCLSPLLAEACRGGAVRHVCGMKLTAVFEPAKEADTLLRGRGSRAIRKVKLWARPRRICWMRSSWCLECQRDLRNRAVTQRPGCCTNTSKYTAASVRHADAIMDQMMGPSSCERKIKPVVGRPVRCDESGVMMVPPPCDFRLNFWRWTVEPLVSQPGNQHEQVQPIPFPHVQRRQCPDLLTRWFSHPVVGLGRWSRRWCSCSSAAGARGKWGRHETADCRHAPDILHANNEALHSWSAP